MRQHLLGYRDNMRVEVETDIAVTAKTVADLRALATWPDGLALNIHVDLDPRFSVVKVERRPDPTMPERRFPPPWRKTGRSDRRAWGRTYSASGGM
jgi:hypothetical protein